MKKKALHLLAFMVVLLFFANVQPVSATGTTQFKITVYRSENGVNSEVIVYQNGSWVNRTVYYDEGNAPKVTLYAMNGSSTWDFELQNDDDWGEYKLDQSTNSAYFYPYPVNSNYAAWIDGVWVGGTGQEFYLRPKFPDLMISKVPSPENGAASPPFCQGQIINWWTKVKNQGEVLSGSTSVGYYIGTSSSDFSNRWGSDSTGTLAVNGESEEYDDYTFAASDVGSRYINVWADYDNDEPESNENNNKSSYGPFQVLPSPAAQFTSDKTSGAYPLTVQFTDQSTGSPTSYLWDFGDGTGPSSQANPIHQYSNTGTFTVTLTISNACGNDIETKTAYISVTDPPPVANFNSDKTSGVSPLVVQFFDQSTGSITSRSWDFGDGTPASTLKDPSHTFANAGDYTVTLTVSGPGGSDSEVKTNYVHVSETVPVAQFSADKTSGEKPLAVQFENLSSGVITTYTWDFGDGTPTSNLVNPPHTYTTDGNFAVTLTVEGPGGSDVEAKTNYIHVAEPAPVARFISDKTNGDKPLTIQFTDQSTGTITSRTWDFGDGSPLSTATSPTHTYSATGIFTVSLSISGPGGTDTEVKTDYITVTGLDEPVISNVKITNVRDTSFTVSWTMDMATGGFVNYGSSSGLGSTAYDERGQSVVDDTHHVTITGLNPETSYFFDVVSGAIIDDNGGGHYQVVTGPTLNPPSSDTVYGQIFLCGSSTPASGSIVYLNIADNNGNGSSGISAPLSSLVDSSGYWFANLGNARIQDLSAYFAYSPSGDNLVLFAQGAADGVGSASFNTSNDSPASVIELCGISTTLEVSSIKLASQNPTSAASVDFAVTFSEPVSGVDPSDFKLTKTGSLTAYAITGVSPDGPADTYTVSVATGKYNGTLRLDVVDDDSIKDANNNPLGGPGTGNGDFTGDEAYTITKKYKSNLKSTAAQDGWLLESGEMTNKGGTLNSGATTLLLGDNAQKKQYRSILSFSTKALPDNAVITKVTLRLKKQGIAGGGNPINLFQGLFFDFKKGYFGSAPGLQASDFQAAANKTYGPAKPVLTNGWYTISLTQAQAYINKLATGGGVTQVRLRFKLDDNNNSVANYLSLYSGNAPWASRPQLIIEYYVP